MGRSKLTAGRQTKRADAGISLEAKARRSMLAQETTWWTILVLTLPVIILEPVMDVTALPRFLLLALFCLIFTLNCFGRRLGRLEIPVPRPLVRLVCALAGAVVLFHVASYFVALNPQEAVFCTARFLLAAIAGVLFTVTVVREEEHLMRLCKGFVIVLATEAVVAIVQFYGLAFTALPPYEARPYGLMGNRNLLGSLLSLLLPFSAYVLYAGSRAWKAGAAAALWLATYALILAQTRTAWVSAFTGTIVSVLLVVSLRRRFGPEFVKGWLKGVGLLILGTGLSLALSITFGNDQELNRSLRDRAGSLAPVSLMRTGDSDFGGRMVLWKGSFRMIQDHPRLLIQAK
jgi:O-antigen ligase